jgi:thiol-disulfide isomerase/thioredoxin
LGKTLKRTAIILLSLILLAASALLVFKLVQHRVESRMRPPHLHLQPEPASNLTYRTLDGTPQTLSSNKGQVVFLDLWGTWCIQCVAEMPKVQQLYDHYKNDPDVKFLIVSRMDKPSAVRSYARRNHLNLPFYVTHDDEIPSNMQLNQFPATFLYAKDGTLVSKHTGAADWSDRSVISFIDALKHSSPSLPHP